MTTVTAELTAGTQVSISNGRHTWRADEPPEARDTDLAPNPYDMLLGALAACTCVTLSLYCRHKGIALKSVATSYEFQRVHADDCDGCDERKGGKIEQVTGFVRSRETLTMLSVSGSLRLQSAARYTRRSPKA